MKLSIVFESDWHAGTGAGQPSGVDRMIARDVDSLPYVHQKHLTGVLRDSAERVAKALDAGPVGPWNDWKTWLFGSTPTEEAPGDDEFSEAGRPPLSDTPTAASLRVGPARFPKDVRDAFVDKPRLVRALTLIRPGVKLEPGLRTAVDKHLRFVEMGRAGLELEAHVDVDDLPGPARALLVCAAADLRRMGGKRRRGAGRCMVTIDDTMLEDELARLEETIAKGEIESPPRIDDEEPVIDLRAVPERAANGTALDLDVVIRLRSAVVIGERVQGNTVSTSDHIPGTHLLPWLSQRLPIDLRPWVAGRHLRVGNGNLVIDDQRSLPFPRSVVVKKGFGIDDNATHWNLVAGDVPASTELPVETRAGRWAIGATSNRLPLTAVPGRSSFTHNTIADGLQTPDESVGGVYTYIGLGEGQEFASQIELSAELAAALDAADPAWVDKLSGPARLGRSLKDYGDVSVTCDRAMPGPEPAVAPDGEVTIWLTSDCVLLDDDLQYAPTASALAGEIAGALGVTVEIADQSVRPTRIESWQRRWVRPRATLPALAAGSVVRFVCSPAPSADALAALQRSGLGERRAEGFGEIVVNHPFVVGPIEAVRGPEPPIPLFQRAEPTTRTPLVEQIELAAWRDEISTRVRGLATNEDWVRSTLGIKKKDDGKKESSTRTQLGAVRAVASLLDTDGGRDQARRWLGHVTSSPSRRKRYPKPLLDEMRALLAESDPSAIWTRLADGARAEDLTLSGDEGIAKCRDSLRWEATSLYLQEVCSAAVKRDQDSGRRSVAQSVSEPQASDDEGEAQ